MATLAELREKRSTLQKEGAGIFAKYGGDVSKLSPEEGARIKAINDELNADGPEYERLVELDTSAKAFAAGALAATTPAPGERGTHTHGGADPQPGDGSDPFKGKRLRDIIGESESYKGFKAGGFKAGSASIEIPTPAGQFGYKALFTLTSSNSSESRDRRPMVPMGREPTTLLDLIPENETGQNSILYLEETTATNTAAGVAEGGTKPDTTLALTERTDPVKKVAVTLTVTREALDDLAWLEGYIRNRLETFVRETMQSMVISGDGVGANLLGVLNRTGIQTFVRGGTDPAESNADAIFRAIIGIQDTGKAEPNAIALRPLNWQTVRLAKTADGAYLFGPPSAEADRRLWGYTVVLSTGLPAATGLVGAFDPHSEVTMREGVNVLMSSEHGTNFVENKVTVLAEARLAFLCFRPSAFAKITALT